LVDGLPALTIGMAASLAVFHRLDISAWFDETYSYGMATQPLGMVLTHWIWGTESNMVLYYLLLRVWLGALSIAGIAPTEVWLRLPSALFAVGAGVVVFLLGRRLFGRVAGLVAGGLYLTNFVQMILAQNARSYTMQLFLLALSWLSLFAGLQTGRRRWWVTYTLSTALSMYAALFSALVIVAQVAALFAMLLLPGVWRHRVLGALRPLAVTLALSFVLVLPLLADVLLHGGPASVPPANLSTLRSFFFFLSGNSQLYERVALGAVAVAFVLAALAYVPRFSRFTRCTVESLGPAVAAGLWFAIPVALSFALTQSSLNLHLFFARYLVVVVPPLCLLIGLAVSALPLRAAQLLAVAGLLVVAWPPFALYYRLAQVQDFKDPAIWMQQRYRTGDGVVCAPDFECSVPMSYYFAAYPGPALDADSPGQYAWSTNTEIAVTADTVRAYEGHHRRIFVVYAPLGRGSASDLDRVEAALRADGYRLVDSIEVHATSTDTTVLLFDTT
jgi:mannosyltransferase